MKNFKKIILLVIMLLITIYYYNRFEYIAYHNEFSAQSQLSLYNSILYQDKNGNSRIEDKEYARRHNMDKISVLQNKDLKKALFFQLQDHDAKASCLSAFDNDFLLKTINDKEYSSQIRNASSGVYAQRLGVESILPFRAERLSTIYKKDSVLYKDKMTEVILNGIECRDLAYQNVKYYYSLIFRNVDLKDIIEISKSDTTFQNIKIDVELLEELFTRGTIQLSRGVPLEELNSFFQNKELLNKALEKIPDEEIKELFLLRESKL